MKTMPKTPIYRALDRNILAVATEMYGCWGAYIGIVPGRDHSEEYKEVLARGTKLREPIAKAIFQSLVDLPYGFE
jgi:hypothetical protein